MECAEQPWLPLPLPWAHAKLGLPDSSAEPSGLAGTTWWVLSRNAGGCFGAVDVCKAKLDVCPFFFLSFFLPSSLGCREQMRCDC